jgi:hypothetical protein
MIMKTRNLVLGVALVAMAAAQPLGAADTTSILTVNATVAATASLTLGAGSISFPDANPDTTASIPGNAALSVVAKGKTSTGSSITLTVLAGGDLTSGTDTIPVSNVTWTTGSSGFVAGTMNGTVAQSVGSWTNSGNRPGSLNFFLANSWDYAVGNYSTTATFTLTAP